MNGLAKTGQLAPFMSKRGFPAVKIYHLICESDKYFVFSTSKMNLTMCPKPTSITQLRLQSVPNKYKYINRETQTSFQKSGKGCNKPPIRYKSLTTS